jgi:hypothetical protein
VIGSDEPRKESIMAKLEKLRIAQINKILGELQKRKRKFDSRGLIPTKEVFAAVKSAYYFGGKADKDEVLLTLKGAINTMVYLGYLKYEIREHDNYYQFFVTFKDVVKDEHGTVIGVRW